MRDDANERLAARALPQRHAQRLQRGREFDIGALMRLDRCQPCVQLLALGGIERHQIDLGAKRLSQMRTQ